MTIALTAVGGLSQLGSTPVTVDSVEHADCAALKSLVAAISQASRTVRAQAEAARSHRAWGSDWEGQAAEAAGHALDSPINQLDSSAAAGSGISTIASVHAATLAAAKAAVHCAATAARGLQLSVSPDGVVSTLPSGWGGVARAAVTTFTPGVAQVLGSIASALTLALQAALSFAHTLDSTSSLAIDAVGSGIAVPEPRRPAAPSANQAQTPPPAVNRIETPQGPIIEVGSIADADEVITLVSGVGSSDADSISRTTAWAQARVEQAQTRGAKVAVVAWHGYSAPPNLRSALSPIPAITAASQIRQFQHDLRERNPHAVLKVVGYSYGSVVVGHAADKSGPGLDADTATLWGSPGAGVGEASDMKINATHPVTDERSGESISGKVHSEHVPADAIQLVTGPLLGVHGPDPSAPSFGGADAPRWSRYLWERLMDLYLVSHGEMDSHSSYMWSPEVNARL